MKNKDRNTPQTIRMNGIRCVFTTQKIEVGRQFKDVKGQNGKVEVINYATIGTHLPVGYEMYPLRKKMAQAAKLVVSGERKEAKLYLERFPQVNTVMGELKARHSFLRGGYTTDGPENCCFLITRK